MRAMFWPANILPIIPKYPIGEDAGQVMMFKMQHTYKEKIGAEY
jgi:hypothetical protein